MNLFEEMRQIGPSPSWQVVPPSDYRDRMANDGPPATPAGGYPLTDHGGSTILQPRLVLVYLGQWWGDTAKLAKFASEVMAYGYLKPLEAYGSGNGTYWGSVQGPAVAGSVTDAQLQTILRNLISANAVPQPDGHTLYALLTPEGVVVQMDAQNSSCQNFCGYHGAIDAKTFYAVQPSTSCATCHGSNNAFDAFCMVLSHEIAEACTDAVPGQGWFNDQTGMENADEWAWIARQWGPWVVQGYQVNGVGNDMGDYTPPQQPKPQPKSCHDLALAILDNDIKIINSGNYLANGAAWAAWIRTTLDAGLFNTTSPVAPPAPRGFWAGLRRILLG